MTRLREWKSRKNKMKIVKTIEISEDNVQEVFDCPAVDSIERIRMEKCDSLDKDIMLVFVNGHKDYTAVGWFLVQDDKGQWHTMSPAALAEEVKLAEQSNT